MWNHFTPSTDYDIVKGLVEINRYKKGIYIGDNFVLKDHGDYVQMIIDSDSPKGHDTWDIYFSEDNSRIVRWEKHK